MAPKEWPKTSTGPSSESTTRARSSSSRSSAYSAASPLSPRPRRSSETSVKCSTRSGVTKRNVVWSDVAPWTSTSGGPSPLLQYAMRVPSPDRTCPVLGFSATALGARDETGHCVDCLCPREALPADERAPGLELERVPDRRSDALAPWPALCDRVGRRSRTRPSSRRGRPRSRGRRKRLEGTEPDRPPRTRTTRTSRPVPGEGGAPGLRSPPASRDQASDVSPPSARSRLGRASGRRGSARRRCAARRPPASRFH